MEADKKIAEFLFKNGVRGYLKRPGGKCLVKKVSEKFIYVGFFGEEVLQILTNEYGIVEILQNRVSLCPTQLEAL